MFQKCVQKNPEKDIESVDSKKIEYKWRYNKKIAIKWWNKDDRSYYTD
jgi:hypothetical protein